MKHLAMTTILASALALGSCAEQPEDPIKTAGQRIDSLFTARYASGVSNGKPLFNQPGGAVLILRGDSTLFDKGYGIADLSSGNPIDGNTFFNIASVSKQFAAVAILKLYHEGKLDIRKSIYQVHPEVNPYLPAPRKPFTDITVQHLLAHSSGIPDARPRDDREFTLTATDMESIQYLKGIDSLNFLPGTNYEYMNPTFQLLYVMIEKLSGKTFEQYMNEEIFRPAGMNETIYFEAGRQIPRMAHGYIPQEESTQNTTGGTTSNVSKQFREYDYGEETFFATKADGGIYTSTREFVKWEQALRHNLFFPDTLREEAHSAITLISGSTYSSYQNRPHTSYGYGWFIEDKPGMPKKIYHTGDNGGFQIYAARYPEKELLILVFENRNDHDRWKMAEELDTILLPLLW